MFFFLNRFPDIPQLLQYSIYLFSLTLTYHPIFLCFVFPLCAFNVLKTVIRSNLPHFELLVLLLSILSSWLCWPFYFRYVEHQPKFYNGLAFFLFLCHSYRAGPGHTFSGVMWVASPWELGRSSFITFAVLLIWWNGIKELNILPYI